MKYLKSYKLNESYQRSTYISHTNVYTSKKVLFNDREVKMIKDSVSADLKLTTIKKFEGDTVGMYAPGLFFIAKRGT